MINPTTHVYNYLIITNEQKTKTKCWSHKSQKLIPIIRVKTRFINLAWRDDSVQIVLSTKHINNLRFFRAAEAVKNSDGGRSIL